MKKFASLLIALLLAVALVGCGGNPDPVDGPDKDVNKTSVNIEGFDLAKTPAQIDIVTADGTDITGTQGNQPYKTCTVSVTGGRDGENFSEAGAQIRVRGNNTASYDKKSFRLKFDAKINLLGLNGGAQYKNWVLLACYKDVSFLRDAVTFEMAKQMWKDSGLYVSDYAFARVTINGNYNGFYMVAEQQQVNKGRIDINEPQTDYTGTDIGYLVEYDGNANMTEPSDRYFMYSYRDYPIVCADGTTHCPSQVFYTGQVLHTVKSDFYSQNQYNFIRSYTKNIFDIIYKAIYANEFYTFNENHTGIVQANFTDSRAAVEAVVDIDSVVDTFILNEVACDNDLDWSSFFFTVDMSKNGNKKLTCQAPWDFDSGYGMMRGLEQMDEIFTANVRTNAMKGLNPYTAVFFKADWFKTAVAERFAELEKQGVFDRAIDLIEKVTEQYKTDFDKNYERWDNLGKIVDDVQSDTVKTFKTHKDASDYLKNWLAHRVEFLSGYFSEIR